MMGYALVEVVTGLRGGKTALDRSGVCRRCRWRRTCEGTSWLSRASIISGHANR